MLIVNAKKSSISSRIREIQLYGKTIRFTWSALCFQSAANRFSKCWVKWLEKWANWNQLKSIFIQLGFILMCIRYVLLLCMQFVIVYLLNFEMSTSDVFRLIRCCANKGVDVFRHFHCYSRKNPKWKSESPARKIGVNKRKPFNKKSIAFSFNFSCTLRANAKHSPLPPRLILFVAHLV